MIEAFGVSLGTFFQLLTTIFSGGIFAAILTFLVRWRGLKNADEADIRDHYAQEVAAMREQMMRLEKHYREMLEQSDRRHRECEETRAQIRQELEGLKRQMVAASTDRVLALGESPPAAPHARAAAERVKKIIEDGGK